MTNIDMNHLLDESKAHCNFLFVSCKPNHISPQNMIAVSLVSKIVQRSNNNYNKSFKTACIKSLPC